MVGKLCEEDQSVLSGTDEKCLQQEDRRVWGVPPNAAISNLIAFPFSVLSSPLSKLFFFYTATNLTSQHLMAG